MKGTPREKLQKLINRLNYNQLSLIDINVNQLVPWLRLNMPEVVAQLEPLGWDLSDDRTWYETAFISHVIRWYGNNVAIFITDSYLDYQLSQQVLACPIMEKFREAFNLQAHTSVLVDSTMFIEMDDLDSIYINLDFNKRYSSIDLSGYDENDELLPHLVSKWGFLEDEMGDNGDYIQWNDTYMIQIK